MPPLLRATATAVNRSDEPRLRLPAACRGRCARVERDLRSGPRRVRALAIFGRSSRAMPAAALLCVGAPAVSANSRRTSARTAFGSAVCGRSGAAYTSASTTSSTTAAGSGTRGGRLNARSPASRRRRSAQQASHSATCSSSIRRAAGESASSTRATSSAPRPGHRSSSWRPSDAAAGVASHAIAARRVMRRRIASASRGAAPYSPAPAARNCPRARDAATTPWPELATCSQYANTGLAQRLHSAANATGSPSRTRDQ